MYDVVLHLRMLQNALGAEHYPTILAIELHLLLRMHLAVLDRVRGRLVGADIVAGRGLVLHTHRQGC